LRESVFGTGFAFVDRLVGILPRGASCTGRCFRLRNFSSTASLACIPHIFRILPRGAIFARQVVKSILSREASCTGRCSHLGNFSSTASLACIPHIFRILPRGAILARQVAKRISPSETFMTLGFASQRPSPFRTH
jgi:hypothetical protein